MFTHRQDQYFNQFHALVLKQFTSKLYYILLYSKIISNYFTELKFSIKLIFSK